MHPLLLRGCITLTFLLGSSGVAKIHAIRSYFNHNPDSSYTEPYRGIVREGDDLESVFEQAIFSAHSRVDLAVQELRLPKIAKALAKKAAEGIPVRIILENQYSRPLSELTPEEVQALGVHERERYDEFVQLVDLNHDGSLSSEEIGERDALIILRNAQIRWRDDTSDGSAGSGLMHHKFLIIDDTITVVSSANLTTSDIHGDFLAPQSRGNRNAALEIKSSEVTRVFREEFEILWKHKFGVKKLYRAPKRVNVAGTWITIQFSPTSKKLGWAASVNGLIERQILLARQTIDMALFVFSEQQLANALESIHGRGARVRVLIDRLFAHRNYSELLDMLGLKLLDDKCRYENGNHPWPSAIHTGGIARLPTGDKLHHKMAVLDGKQTLFGSYNWSNAANRQNDETFLVIEDPKVSQAFLDEFQRLYSEAVLGKPAWLLQKIRKKELDCGSVGLAQE